MRKRFYFNSEHGWEWPTVDWLKPFFLNPPGQRWFFETGNDGGSLVAEGLNGTEHLKPGVDRIDLHLGMDGHPDLGVILFYHKMKDPRGAFWSKGDLSRLHEWVQTLHGDLRPIGLYIPYEKAWLAVKEFIETDGELPTSIEWVRAKELPPDTFPDPPGVQRLRAARANRSS